MTKPDAFQLSAERLAMNWLKRNDPQEDIVLFLARTLRRQHARVVLLVKREKVDAVATGETGDRIYNQACDDILAALAKMKKGKP